MSEESDTSRVQVLTYVPSHQKEVWEEHAEELDMSQSEFVRMMVQAGRSNLLGGDSSEAAGGASSDSNPQGLPVEDLILDALSTEEARDWDDLVTLVTENIEEELEGTLQSLQSQNQVQYSGRQGGYILTDE